MADNLIGTEPNQIPVHGHFGGMAYQQPDSVNITGGTLNGVPLEQVIAGASGAVQTVAGKGPDGNGNVVLVPEDVGADLEFRIFESGANRFFEWRFVGAPTWTRISNVNAFGLPAVTEEQMQDNPQSNWTTAVTPQRLFYYLQDIGLMSPYRTILEDLDDALLGISFQWGGSTLNTPVSGSWGRGITLPASLTNSTQIGIINGQSVIWVRHQASGTWSDWIRSGVQTVAGKSPNSSGNVPLAYDDLDDKPDLALKRDKTDNAFPRYDLASTATTDTLDLAAQQVFRVAASANRTLAFANAPAAGRAMAVLVRVTGSSGTITWPSGIVWSDGAAPVLRTAWTLVTLLWDGDEWSGYMSGGDD